jgi:peptidylprolyl isomerase
MRPRLLLPAALSLLAAALGACGGSKAPGVQPAPGAGGTTLSAPPSTTTTTPTPAATTPKPPSPLSKKPAISVPKGAPPTKLVTKDLVSGAGTAAKSGNSLTVNYVGVLYKGGKEFDSSWKTGKPFPFQLGRGSVIPGWDQGLVGMKVGGRRELIIPPQLAYGKQGSPPTIPPNSTLVFVIDLLGAR